MDAHIYSPILQYSHLFLSALSNVAYYLYRFIFFTAHSFHLFAKFVRCPTNFTLVVFVLTSVLALIFFHIHILVLCVYFVSFSKKKIKKNTTYFLRSWLQINFKVCRADLFPMFIFAVLFLSMPLRLFGICVYFHIFFLHTFIWSLWSRSVKMDNLYLSLVRREPNEKNNTHTHTQKTMKKRCKPISHTVHICMDGPGHIELTATIHIVHRKTENKSHVRAHNVLQTSYITCSGDVCFLFLFLQHFASF